MENIKRLKMSDILRRDGVFLLNANMLKNPDDISKENNILYDHDGEILLDLNESIIRFKLPEGRNYWMLMDVTKINRIETKTIDLLETETIYRLETKTEDNDTINILYFMCGEREYNMMVTDDELEEIYKKLRELNRYDILIKCQG